MWSLSLLLLLPPRRLLALRRGRFAARYRRRAMRLSRRQTRRCQSPPGFAGFVSIAAAEPRSDVAAYRCTLCVAATHAARSASAVLLPVSSRKRLSPACLTHAAQAARLRADPSTLRRHAARVSSAGCRCRLRALMPRSLRAYACGHPLAAAAPLARSAACRHKAARFELAPG